MKMKNQEIICNCCKKLIQEPTAIPRTEYLHVEKKWGYFSEKDGEEQEFDICETCYDKWVQNFQIPVEVKEVHELL